jgi:hypothetical protein
MKKLLLASLLLSGCGLFQGALQAVSLTPQQEAILVEETTPPRNEWLYDNCQIKNVDHVITPRRAKINADKSGANYVEVLYSDSPFSLYSVMFSCPNIPPY